MLHKFMQEHNAHVTQHITRNLLLAVIVMGTSVFSYGFETSIINTTQAMDGRHFFFYTDIGSKQVSGPVN